MNSFISEFEVGRLSIRKQLTEHLREMILTGKVSEGDKIPSNKELSERWQVASSSVQAAMKTLVREGLLDRARKRGTFVAKRSRKVTRVGVYLSENVWQMPHAIARRSTISVLGEQLRRRGLEMDVWLDSRPRTSHAEPLAGLVRAAEQRRIQSVYLPWGEPFAWDWIERLPVPWVAFTPCPVRNRVFIDMQAIARLAVEELAGQGCKSVCMIAPQTDNPQSEVASQRIYAECIQTFRRLGEAAGLEVHDDWTRHIADGTVREERSEHYGYEVMKQVLSVADRPEGIFVMTDVVARGALMAVLESKVSVPNELKLVLHRNVEVDLLCPVKASFLDFSMVDRANAMIGMVEAQLRGEEIEPVLLVPNIHG